MGDRLKIAQSTGATYELFSNSPIPQLFKDYLKKRNSIYKNLKLERVISMSISASIDISFAKNDIYNFSVIDVIDAMLKNNWKVINKKGVYYLPFGDDDLFDWHEKEINLKELKKIIEQKENAKETIGLVFYWESTDIGVTMLQFDDHMISFILNINRVKITSLDFMDITDVNWYLERIIPCFNKKNFQIVNINFIQD